MNYKEAIDTITSAIKEVNPTKYQLNKARKAIHCLKEACWKAEQYDDEEERLRKEMQMIYNAQIVKTHTAKEIIEMIDAMCADEKADVIWQSGAYIRNKYIAQKIKERYGIK
jgi:histidinol-phosphate/aromatic aminotransferase/cobyric acid decarboxylase-like protein